ncbi:MAG: MBOAT family O-acyltransferase [Lachnospiraceae bacterium]|nr:MBOAT family O-acyltransferase [Lachnospiraceae bacterium]
MVFSSFVFICIFLPVTCLLNFVSPSLKVKNIVLTVVSILFYAYGEPVYVLLMLASALFNYLFAYFIDKERQNIKARKLILSGAVIVNLGVLGVFKYLGFLVETINSVCGIHIPVPAISLPIGISFFTFQALSYVIDVYREDVKVQKNFGKVLLYISFFPQLIAGPIVKYHDISDQLDHREESMELMITGWKRFVIGLGKKVLIANTVGSIADTIFALESGNMNSGLAWIGAIAYAFQIYYDFSGYSDMAIGLGCMFGFRFKENFLYPYAATSMKDFWRRWHISLSTWFKEYLYIPLGGNRKGKIRTIVNKFIVFFCTGLWHGASFTFILWGLYHGAFLMLEEMIPKVPNLIQKTLGRVYALLVIVIGFVLFRADTVGQAGMMISKMFTGVFANAQTESLTTQLLNPWNLFILVIALIGMGPIKIVLNKLKEMHNSTSIVGSIGICMSYIVTILIFVWCMFRLASSTYNPFIYFRF